MKLKANLVPRRLRSNIPLVVPNGARVKIKLIDIAYGLFLSLDLRLKYKKRDGDCVFGSRLSSMSVEIATK
jgi:hypothetical protein